MFNLIRILSPWLKIGFWTKTSHHTKPMSRDELERLVPKYLAFQQIARTQPASYPRSHNTVGHPLSISLRLKATYHRVGHTHSASQTLLCQFVISRPHKTQWDPLRITKWDMSIYHYCSLLFSKLFVHISIEFYACLI